ncbi:hypothetical protein A3A14_02055 [Candidatus Daviesbacteria bacterium RIFCSPLOWO2_01_FULL_43_38]|uniref:Septum formation initiator n=2 Tax=Candidatus Daviesiibacteriota TaxID=1752718 RepID=A0A1F5K817_9BACT|nr:MAG: Septum formation initiator [Candidatus Daviesbacteria bacterium GW2011_GWA1_42_6]OGE19833.1 MAG: hypothetical protein A2874_02815 [Candidatus Daviesbacteria bacterium RIFCSPHIGHO2_01_FULL_43_17]OGE36938.1 MAG: hypothetical protein A3E45_01695 [Candidatus Daviesbacteria bacterium RIFCSPHIGHO2_12_FULL_43_11]OGE63636.1 MAG: hypothetical protein A3A14_02055 [Candidatus Daviesbacteria bacterium RIFCSPLOWO2_01_FULL_43_38]
MIKKIIFVLGVILVIVMVYGFGKQIFSSLEAGKRLDNEAEKLTLLQRRNEELKKKLVEVGSLQFIEQQARDKLSLARPGETIMVIPQSEIDKVLGAQKEVQKIVEPYWQGWLRLFWR